MVPVSDAPQVTDNQAESRFELRADGHVAELEYRRNGKRLVLIHTEVPAELEGRGFGGRLVAAAVDRAAREGLTVVPLCPFARGWLERHPAEAAQATVDWGDRGGTAARWPVPANKAAMRQRVHPVVEAAVVDRARRHHRGGAGRAAARARAPQARAVGRPQRVQPQSRPPK